MNLEEMRLRFERFVAPPDENGCRLWTGGKTSSGYGHFNIGRGEQISAHVASWRLAHGWRRVPRGWVVRHRCDVRLCVEETHLVSGTHSQNARECYARRRRTAPRAAALLTAEMVEEGRRLYQEDRLTQRELARLWGVNPSAVSRVMRGETYVEG